MNAALGKSLSDDDRTKDNPFSGLAQVVAANMVGTMVDSFVTPDGFARLASGDVPGRSESFDSRKYRTFDEAMRAAAKMHCAEAMIADADAHPGKIDFAGLYEAVVKARCPQIVSWEYKGLDTFLVKSASSRAPDEQVVLVLHRTGILQWKVTAVRFPVQL